MNAEQYGLYRGVSKMTVSRWCSQGKIPAVKIGKEWHIDPDAADAMLPETQGLREQRQVAVAEREPVVAAEPKQQVKRVASPRPAKPIPEPKIHHPGANGPTFAEAQRAREVYRAERERLALLREKEELVPVDDVKREAFSLAKVIRETLINIPDRVANQFAAETDPQAIHVALTEELTSALGRLADA